MRFTDKHYTKRLIFFFFHNLIHSLCCILDSHSGQRGKKKNSTPNQRERKQIFKKIINSLHIKIDVTKKRQNRKSKSKNKLTCLKQEAVNHSETTCG